MESPSNVAFSIFGFDIMWYGILVAFGIAAVVGIICFRAPKHHGISFDKTMNFCIVLVISGVIGARLYYVLFNWIYYSEDITRIFMFRSGGLAIHGGLLAGSLVAIILCRFWKERTLNVLDLCFTVIPLGQAVGRWGNFFNGEAHGGETDLPWGVIIDGVTYHPTFLYESIWCLLLFVFLLIVDNRRKFEGQVFLLYVILYSFERFFVEGMRTDSLMLFGSLKQAQVISVIAIVVGILAYIFLYKRSTDESKIDVQQEGTLDKTEDGNEGEGFAIDISEQSGIASKNSVKKKSDKADSKKNDKTDDAKSDKADSKKNDKTDDAKSDKADSKKNDKADDAKSDSKKSDKDNADITDAEKGKSDKSDAEKSEKTKADKADVE